MYFCNSIFDVRGVYYVLTPCYVNGALGHGAVLEVMSCLCLRACHCLELCHGLENCCWNSGDLHALSLDWIHILWRGTYRSHRRRHGLEVHRHRCHRRLLKQLLKVKSKRWQRQLRRRWSHRPSSWSMFFNHLCL